MLRLKINRLKCRWIAWVKLPSFVIAVCLSGAAYANEYLCVTILEPMPASVLDGRYTVGMNQQWSTLGSITGQLDNQITDEDLRQKLLASRSGEKGYKVYLIYLKDQRGETVAHFIYRLIPGSDALVADSLVVVPQLRRKGVSQYLVEEAMTRLPTIRRLVIFLDEVNRYEFNSRPDLSDSERFKITPAYKSFKKFGFYEIRHVSITKAFTGPSAWRIFPQILLTKP